MENLEKRQSYQDDFKGNPETPEELEEAKREAGVTSSQELEEKIKEAGDEKLQENFERVHRAEKYISELSEIVDFQIAHKEDKDREDVVREYEFLSSELDKFRQSPFEGEEKGDPEKYKEVEEKYKNNIRAKWYYLKQKADNIIWNIGEDIAMGSYDSKTTKWIAKKVHDLASKAREHGIELRYGGEHDPTDVVRWFGERAE